MQDRTSERHMDHWLNNYRNIAWLRAISLPLIGKVRVKKWSVFKTATQVNTQQISNSYLKIISISYNFASKRNHSGTTF